jgi:hypothetical protein
MKLPKNINQWLYRQQATSGDRSIEVKGRFLEKRGFILSARSGIRKHQRQLNVNDIKATSANKSLQATRYTVVLLKFIGSGEVLSCRQFCRFSIAVA